jgi:protein phosphatase
VDVTEVNPLPGERYLLCSDGLFAVATDEVIQGILAGDAALDEICRRLVDVANERGGPDNITTLVLEINVP